MPRTIKDCRILLIEDERSVREILKGLLKYIGVKEVDDYSSAESGWDALMGTKAEPDRPRDFVADWEQRLLFELRYNPENADAVAQARRIVRALRRAAGEDTDVSA